MAKKSSDSKQNVSGVDSAGNSFVRDVIGNKSDTNSGNSLFSLVNSIEDHIHSESKVFPTAGTGVTVTCGTVAWTLGGFTEVIPTNTVSSIFDLHYVNLEGASADSTYELVFYESTVEIGRIRLTSVAIANATVLNSYPVHTTVLSANSQVQTKIMSSSGAADTITFSVFYHEYS